MTKEELDLLEKLLKKANENALIKMYDKDEQIYEIDYIFQDSGDICIKINEF